MSTAENMVIDGLERDYAVEVVSELCARRSVSGEEAEVSAWTAGELRRLGLDVMEQEVLPGRTNIIGTFDTGQPGPTLLFNGHLDTLPVPEGGRYDPFKPHCENGRLYGGEITNMKGAVGAMITAIRSIMRCSEDICGRITLSAVIGECDTLGLGTLHMLESGMTADAAINGEPTDLQVMACHAGVTQLRMSARGIPVHVCRRAEGHNAIDDLVAVAATLNSSALSYEPQLDFEGLPTLNIGTIRGGSMPSMLAGEAEALIDVRTVPGMTPESVLADILAHVEAVRVRYGRRPVDVELVERPGFCQEHPYQIDQNAPVVRAVVAGHEYVIGTKPNIGPLFPQIFYGTDASHLSRAGIPTVIYGPGKVDDINVPDESMAIDDLMTAAQVYALAAGRICARG